MERLHFAQLGCELLSKIRATSLTCFVGTSSKERVLTWFLRLTKITAREFGAQLGSSPLTSTRASPPPAGTRQMRKSEGVCDVKTIHLPSGDQSGSVQLPTPAVEMWRGPPPFA